ncbi:MAG: peroxisomal biogenesis factor 3 [Pseudomonadota bacterium]|nr:peroxisomal biogenesis factor 3 [Pseudomonadota bacterium]
MSERDKQREERLAAALRENLRRRKAQTREGEPLPQPPSDD